MKKKIFLFVVLICTIILTGCGKKEESPKPEESKTEPAIMWEVTSKNGGKLYLVGSIHVGKEDMYPLNPALTNAFNKSDALVVEVDIVEYENDYSMALESVKTMLYLDGTTIKDHISEDLYKKLEKRLETFQMPGYTNEQLYLFKPFALSMLLDETSYDSWGVDPDLGIDGHFLKLAKEKNMPIIEIETAIFQLKLFDGSPIEFQELLLESSLMDDNDENGKLTNEMIKLWNKGDSAAFEKLLKDIDTLAMVLMTEKDRKLYEEFNKKLLDERNVGMVKKAEELLKNKKTYFYVVGTAHMFGDTGIVKQLESKGYTVTKK